MVSCLGFFKIILSIFKQDKTEYSTSFNIYVYAFTTKCREMGMVLHNSTSG